MKGAALVGALLATAAAASAQESAAFLKIGPGSRAAGMGGAYTAFAAGVDAIVWNPARLSLQKKRELGAAHAELKAGTRYDFLGYAHPAARGVFGISATLLHHAPIDARDASGLPDGRFNAYDAAFGAAYGFRVPSLPALRLGMGVRWIRGVIAEASAQTVAGDIAAAYDFAGAGGEGNLLAGLAVQNIGSGLRFIDETSPLPLTFALGLGTRLFRGVLAAVDYKHRPRARVGELNVGGEFTVFQGFALRAGIDARISRDTGVSDLSLLNGFAAGFGYGGTVFSVDYAMTPFGVLGRIQRLSMAARF